jgi:hypothetical protein
VKYIQRKNKEIILNNDALLLTIHKTWSTQIKLELAVFDLYRHAIDKSALEFINDIPQAEREPISAFFTSVFPPIEYGAMLLISYSQLESSLMSLCKSLDNLDSNNLKVSELSGTGIGRSKTFLEQSYFKIKPLFSSTEWQNLQQISQVRNVIIHCAGEIDGTNKKHKAEIAAAKKGNAKITGSKAKKIEITEDYLLYAFTAYNAFLDAFEQQLKISHVEAHKALNGG